MLDRLFLVKYQKRRKVDGRMDVSQLIQQKLDESGLEQRDLANAAEVTESYISQLLSRKKMPPAPDRTDIYDKLGRFLKLPAGTLAGLADLQRPNQVRVMQRAVAGFIASLRKQDRLAIGSFDSELQIQTDWTGDRETALLSLPELIHPKAAGSTNLYAALERTLRTVSENVGKTRNRRSHGWARFVVIHRTDKKKLDARNLNRPAVSKSAEGCTRSTNTRLLHRLQH